VKPSGPKTQYPTDKRRHAHSDRSHGPASERDNTHSLPTRLLVLVPYTKNLGGARLKHPRPTWHCTFCLLKINATCFSSSCIYHNQHGNMPQLLQPLAGRVVSRESCLLIGMSDLRCSFSVSCQARSVIVQCRPVVIVAFPHVMFQIDCYQPTSCFVLQPMTVCNAEQTKTETCVVGTTHFAKLCCSAGSR
jgi:hypothetical protein